MVPVHATGPKQKRSATPGPSDGRGPVEPHRARPQRPARRQAPYLRAGLVVALLAVLIALVAANTRTVTIDWVIGTSNASLVWIVFVAALTGGLLGILTGTSVRRRTRRRAEPGHPPTQ
jgi:uncharacterized integral membrane protein